MTINSVTLITIKEKLTAEKQKLKERLTSLAAQDPYTDPARLNDNAASDTEASEESSHERMEALEKELNTLIAEIDSTLIRIDKLTYGVCTSCSQDIDLSRLSIKPTALYCMECEKKRSPQKS